MDPNTFGPSTTRACQKKITHNNHILNGVKSKAGKKSEKRKTKNEKRKTTTAVQTLAWLFQSVLIPHIEFLIRHFLAVRILSDTKYGAPSSSNRINSTSPILFLSPFPHAMPMPFEAMPCCIPISILILDPETLSMFLPLTLTLKSMPTLCTMHFLLPSLRLPATYLVRDYPTWLQYPSKGKQSQHTHVRTHPIVLCCVYYASIPGF
jgi:hypothetical protein